MFGHFLGHEQARGKPAAWRLDGWQVHDKDAILSNNKKLEELFASCNTLTEIYVWAGCTPPKDFYINEWTKYVVK